MKRIIIYSLLIIIFTLLGYVGYLNKPVYYPEEILNNPYYKYNYKKDSYEEIIINKSSITYNGTSFNIDNCKSYTYNKDTGIIKMDCGRAFRIIYASNDVFVLNIDNENHYFYKNQIDSYNKEFNLKYNMTYNDLEYEADEKLSKVRISAEKLFELINGENNSYILIKNDNCTSNCVYAGYYIDTILTGKPVYYIDSASLNDEEVALINNYDENILNKEEAKVIEVSNGVIKAAYYIQTNGFDSLSGYLDTLVVNEGETINE